MAEVAEETGAVLQVGQIDRFEPVFLHARRLVEGGDLGCIFFAEAAFQGRGWTQKMPADWWGRDPRNPELVLISVGCMPVSLLRWLVGPITEVSAYGFRHGWTHQSHHDTVIANLRFESGAVGRILVTEAAQRPYGLDLTLYGDEGTLRNNRLVLNRWTDLGRDEFTELPIPEIPWKSYPDPAIQGLFNAEIRAFVQAIEEGTAPPVDAREGAAIMATLEAIAESLGTGQPVAVPASV